jgi:hypothetical protein
MGRSFWEVFDGFFERDVQSSYPLRPRMERRGSAVAFLPSPIGKQLLTFACGSRLLKRTERTGGNFGAITMMEFSQLLYIALYLL